MSQCTAKSKRSGERCKAAAITGAATCRMHGGTRTRKAREERVRRALELYDFLNHPQQARPRVTESIRREIEALEQRQGSLAGELAIARTLLAWALERAEKDSDGGVLLSKGPKGERRIPWVELVQRFSSEVRALETAHHALKGGDGSVDEVKAALLTLVEGYRANSGDPEAEKDV